MTRKKPPTMQQGHSDHFQTPDYALRPLIPYLKPGAYIWECAEGTGNLGEGLESQGFGVRGSDLYPRRNQRPIDFLDTNDYPDWLLIRLGIIEEKPALKKFDYIITNPPYSLKNEFLKQCYDIGLPFALLQPITFFGTFKRQRMFADYDLDVLFLGGRINFETPSGQGSGAWFETMWVTRGILPERMVFPTNPIDRTPLEKKE